MPSNEIASLDQEPITFIMDIGIYISNENRKKLVTEDLEALFGTNDIFKAHVTSINVDASQAASIKTPVKLEQLVMKHYEVKAGNLLIVEWKNQEDEILVTSDRTIFISEKVCKYLWCSFL